MCLKSEGIQFPFLRLFAFLFFPRGFHPFAFWWCFCFFSLVFVNQVFFCFFLFSLYALFFAPHSKTQEITLLSPWYVPSLSFRTFSLSLSFLEKKRKRNTSRARKCPLYGRSFFARARYASFFLTRCGFSANFWAKKSPLSHEERVLSANVGNRARVNSRATSILSKLH